ASAPDEHEAHQQRETDGGHWRALLRGHSAATAAAAAAGVGPVIDDVGGGIATHIVVVVEGIHGHILCHVFGRVHLGGVTGIAHAVVVGVGLVGVCHHRAVVDVATDGVAVAVVVRVVGTHVTDITHAVVVHVGLV